RCGLRALVECPCNAVRACGILNERTLKRVTRRHRRDTSRLARAMTRLARRALALRRRLRQFHHMTTHNRAATAAIAFLLAAACGKPGAAPAPRTPQVATDAGALSGRVDAASGAIVFE